jgi:hypothetical protein
MSCITKKKIRAIRVIVNYAIATAVFVGTATVCMAGFLLSN